MSEELVKVLERRLGEAERANAGLNAEIKDLRRAKRDLNAKLEGAEKEVGAKAATLAAEIEALTKDRDGWQQKATAAPSEEAKQIADLQGKIRERDHRDAWREAIGKELQEKASVDDVWAKVGYKPEADAVDPNQITELVTKARDLAPYLFSSRDADGQSAASQGATQTAVKSPLKVADTASRGARDTAVSSLRYSKDELKVGGWMHTPRGKEIVSAMQAGTAVQSD